MSTVPALFDRWLRRPGGAQADSSTPERAVVLSSAALWQGVGFRWISTTVSHAARGDPICVDLWTLREQPATRSTFAEVCAGLELANCAYDQLAEVFLIRGRILSRQVVLRSNLVSPSVEDDPLLSGAFESGSRVRFWTYSVSPTGFEVLPYCSSPASGTERTFASLSRLLRIVSRPVERPHALPSRSAPSPDRRRFVRDLVSIRTPVGFSGAGRRIVEGGEATISDLSPGGARLTDVSLPVLLRALEAGSIVLGATGGRGSFSPRATVVRFHLREKSGTLGVEFRGGSRRIGRALDSFEVLGERAEQLIRASKQAGLRLQGKGFQRIQGACFRKGKSDDQR